MHTAVRHIVVDKKQLATLGEEERSVKQGTAVLGPEQRAFIARWLPSTFQCTFCA